MLYTQVNFSAVVVAALINIVLGSLWYSPLLFGAQWVKLSGMKMGDQNMPMWRSYGLMFLSSLVMAYALAQLVAYTFSFSALEGALTGACAAIGFVFTTSSAAVLFGGKSKMLYLIDNGYYLVGFAVMGALLAVWQ